MEHFYPSHETVSKQSFTLKSCLTAVTKSGDPVFVLEPKHWFTQGQGSGTFVWNPTPAAASIIVGQLGKA